MKPENDLRRIVESRAERLHLASEDIAGRRPDGGGWSAKEIIGHLIDSAANNHRRFIEGQVGDDLVFPGYDQDRWVSAQDYQDRSWPALIELWRRYNLHLADVMASMPEEVRKRPRPRHNLQQIAWEPPGSGEAATLGYLMRDYVEHLSHHLSQIDRALGSPERSLSTVEADDRRTDSGTPSPSSAPPERGGQGHAIPSSPWIDPAEGEHTVIVTVDAAPEVLDELAAHAREGLDRFREFPGFLGGALHVRDDRTRMVQLVRWSSEAEYRACIDDPHWDDVPSTRTFMDAVRTGRATMDVGSFRIDSVSDPAG